MKHYLCTWVGGQHDFTCEQAAHEFAKAFAKYAGQPVTIHEQRLKLGDGALVWVPTGHCYEVRHDVENIVWGS